MGQGNSPHPRKSWREQWADRKPIECWKPDICCGWRLQRGLGDAASPVPAIISHDDPGLGGTDDGVRGG